MKLKLILIPRERVTLERNEMTELSRHGAMYRLMYETYLACSYTASLTSQLCLDRFGVVSSVPELTNKCKVLHTYTN